MSDVPKVSWEKDGLAIGPLSLAVIAELISKQGHWIFSGDDIFPSADDARKDEPKVALMTELILFTTEWVRRLDNRHIEEVVAVLVPRSIALVEDRAKILATQAVLVWDSKVEEEKKAAKEKAKALTQKAKLVCAECAALENLFSRVSILGDDALENSPFRDQVVSLGIALESLADIISKAITDLLNGDPSTLREFLVSVEGSEVNYATVVAIDAVGSGHELGLGREELEQIFHGAFFPELFRKKFGIEHAARTYELVLRMRPKLPDIAQLIRDHGRTDWMNMPVYRRATGSWEAERVSEGHVLKVLVVSLLAEYHERLAAGEKPKVILEHMAGRYAEPTSDLYNAIVHVTASSPIYTKALAGVCNRFGVVPRKAIVRFSVPRHSLEGRRSAYSKSTSAKYLGLDGGVGISLGDRNDLRYSPHVWLFWKEVRVKAKAGSGEFQITFRTLAAPDTTSALSVTATASENGEPRMALILVGYGDLNPQIFGRGRRKVIGFLDTASFAKILNSIQRSVNIPRILEEIETYHAARSVNGSNS